MSLMFKFSWEMLFFESGDTGVFRDGRNKLFASNKKQINNYTLMLDMLYLYILVVCTCHCRGVSKKTFWCGYCFLLIFVAKKGSRDTELQSLCTKALSKVEE